MAWWEYILVVLPVAIAYVVLAAWVWIDSDEQYHRLKGLYDRNPDMTRPRKFR